jgi:hypothetical protein
MSIDGIWDYASATFPAEMLLACTFTRDLKEVSADCNLWPNVLLKYLSMADLPTVTVTEHKRELSRLVATRNDIAHGKDIVIQSLVQYKHCEEAVIAVMYNIGISVIEAIISRAYAR